MKLQFGFLPFCLAAFVATMASWPAAGMGLRSLVALPVNAHGAVLRLAYLGQAPGNNGTLISTLAYGVTARSTVLIGAPYRFSSSGDGALPVSLLYRRTIWQQDRSGGTSRLAWLAGASLPAASGQKPAAQAGFVYTRFEGRHELDVDGIYRHGLGARPDSAQFDVSWQYRIAPHQRPDWGLVPDINLVLEYNAQWQSGAGDQKQLTAGAQWAGRRWVVEGGYGWGLTRGENNKWLVSARYHF